MPDKKSKAKTSSNKRNKATKKIKAKKRKKDSAERQKITKEQAEKARLYSTSHIQSHVKVDSWFYLFKVLPGILTWTVLLSPIWLTLLGLGHLMAYYVAFLTVYWVYKAVWLCWGITAGYFRHKRDLKINWQKKIEELDWKKLPNPEQLPKKKEDFRLYLLIPMYKEPMEVLEETMQSVVKSTFPTKQIVLTLAVEERGGKEAEKIAKTLQEKYGKNFDKFLYFVHPADIPGEVKGTSSANKRWASIKTVELLRKEGYDVRKMLFFNHDCDLKQHSKFMSAIVYNYFVTPNRTKRFFSDALHLFTNNIWEVPPLMRIQGNSMSLAMLSAWVMMAHNRETFSSFGINLGLLIDIKYWDPRFIDDTTTFWKCFLHLNGDFRGVETYVPTYSDAVHTGGWTDSHIAQYKQMLRWGWGAIIIPVAMSGMIRNKQIPLKKKLQKTMLIFEAYVFWITMIFLLSFALPIVGFVDSNWHTQIVAYGLPKMMSVLLTIALVFLIPPKIILDKLHPNRPKYKGLRRIWFEVWLSIEHLGILLNILGYNFIPFVHAQTEMLVGKITKDYYATEKIRK